MAYVAVSVDITAYDQRQLPAVIVHTVRDSVGSDRAAQFRAFCSEHSLPITNAAEVERAAADFAKVIEPAAQGKGDESEG